MNPIDDQELSRLLRQWEAPVAPPGLKHRVFQRSAPWWRWLLAGTIRVPVPLGAAALALLALWAYTNVSTFAPVTRPEPSVSLADFRPVDQVEPRIVGERK